MDSIFTRTSGFLVSIVLCHKAFCLIKGLQCALTQNHYQQSRKTFETGNVCASVFAHDAPMPKFTNSFADDGSVMELGRNLQLISGDPEVPEDVVAALAQLNAQLDRAMSKGLPMAWSSPPDSASL